MKSITLSAAGLVFNSSFTTVVSKVINPGTKSRIVLDSMPHVEISLGETTADSLEIHNGTEITVKPVEGSADNSFTLEIGPKVAPKTKGAAPAKSSSPATPIENRRHNPSVILA